MRPVLNRFLSLSGSGRQQVVALMLFLVLGAVTQGIAFALVVPITDGVFARSGPVPWGWIATLVAIAAVQAVLHHRSVPMGNRLGADLVTTLHRAVAERASVLPARSLGPAHADRIASLDGTAVVVLMGLPAHVLRPLVAAVATPLTVILITAFVEIRFAAGLAVGLVLMVAASFGVVRLLTRTEETDSAEWLRRVFTQPAAAEHAPEAENRAPSALPHAVGEVLLWRVVEIALCPAVAACVVLTTTDDLSPGTAVALVVLAVLTFRPVMEAALLSSTVMKSRGVLTTIGRLLDAGDAEPPRADWPEHGDIEFDDVGLLVGRTTVLAGVSFRLPAGTTTVITGTPDGNRLVLGDLLAGDVRPTSGQVRIGGVDVGLIAASETARRLCRVSPADPALTREEAARFLGSPEGSGLPDLPGVADALDRLRATVSAPSEDVGPPLSGPDLWRLALLRAVSADPAAAVVDATAGEDLFTGDPELAELLSAFTRGRTCWLVLGAGHTPPPCGASLTVDGSHVSSGTQHGITWKETEMRRN
ncbi:hypothetical protein [Streptomyces sp. HB132]|uniref:hypothetical protein n=1 Tax=Streptomyces sp. HB132 TaxID=767388 RepID=UPI00195FB41E|nr:hypothetical protein [Streptomyces sp. HB132]MBM7442699.1 ABC-type multidrug transport system fused ATPase/permease subunit [Streptomyces sp. HB132]